MGKNYNSSRLVNGLSVDANGNVGVGNSPNASYKLTVTGTSLFTGAATFSSSITGTIIDSTSNAFRLSGNNALSLVTLNSQSVVKINAAGFWGTQIVGANDQGILITNTGNVGIGTTSTSAKTEIRGNGNTAINSAGTLFVTTGGTATQAAGAGGQISFGAWLNGDLSVPYPVAAIKGVSESSSTDINKGALIFATMNNTTNAERMRITSDGRVGINTSSPQYLFAVSGGRANLPYICSNQFIAGQITGNLAAVNSPNFILMFNMTDDPAGWSCSGTVNAAAWDCWNISTIWVRKLNGGTTVNAGVTGLYKSGCDFAICDITYVGKRWIAFRFTSNPEINVMLTGYGLNTQFNSDGSAQVVSSGVSVNSILASY